MQTWNRQRAHFQERVGVKWQPVVVIEVSSKEVLYERVTLCHVTLNGKNIEDRHKMKKREVSQSVPA